MKILNLGSLNIDHVYQVPHFVRPGETLGSVAYARHAGGKGLNQSVALGRAGAEVWHAGKIGADGLFLKQILEDSGVNASLIQIGEVQTGHAIIQVDANGQNAILLDGGSNRTFTPEEFDRLLSRFATGDFLLLQNEINDLDVLMHKAAARGLRIAINPSPLDAAIPNLPLGLCELVIVNEMEGEALTGATGAEACMDAFRKKYPDTDFLMTLGAAGACFAGRQERLSVPGKTVAAIDTTGAGDTFAGYFLAALLAEKPIDRCLAEATAAAALSVTRLGAAGSIPRREEIQIETVANPG